MTVAAEKPKIPTQCSRCRASRGAAVTPKGAARLPGGWKDQGEERICGDCWSKAYVLRAVTFPLASPCASGDAEEKAQAWRDFDVAIRKAWGEATSVANWATTELARTDVVRLPADKKLRPREKVYLYPGARQVAPELSTSSVVALLHAVEGKYREARFEVIWRRDRALPTFRYPTPLPIGSQNWSASVGEGGEALVSVPIGDRRWTLRLRGGHQFARQRAAFDRLVAGQALPGELAIYEDRGSSGDHRHRVNTTDAGGSNKRHSRTMVKLCLWLPKENKASTGTLYVSTRRDCLLSWSFDNQGQGEIYRYNADHVRRWVAEHRERLQRTSDDLKREKRWPAQVRAKMVGSREPWVEKQHRRLDAATHEASAMIAGVASRRRVATVVYDDHERGFVESFPWADLDLKIGQKVVQKGIEFLWAPCPPGCRVHSDEHKAKSRLLCPTTDEPASAATAAGTAASCGAPKKSSARRGSCAVSGSRKKKRGG